MSDVLRHLDLFSGIGGNAYAADTVWDNVEHTFCEIAPFCRKALAKHWPESKIYEDIRTLKGSDIGPVHIVTGGFPCQPFSLAGKRKGKGDDRDLWPEMFRVISEVRPTWVIGENVAGFTGMELDRSISDMESIGYAVQTFDIPAVAVDAKHIRHRVWIIAHSDEGERFPVSIQSPEGRASSKSADAPRSSSHVADGSKGRFAGSTSERPYRKRKHGAKARIGTASRDRSTDGCGWPAEPRVGRVAHGIPDRVDRVEALGNSIVPQVVAQIMRAIKEIES